MCHQCVENEKPVWKLYKNAPLSVALRYQSDKQGLLIALLPHLFTLSNECMLNE